MSFKPKMQPNSIGQLIKNNPAALRTTVDRSTYADPATVKDRIRIIFDDSGSMRFDKLKDAQDGTVEFLKNCALNQVAVAIHPLHMEATPIETNLPALAASLANIKSTGSTPLYETLWSAQKAQPPATRYIVFSDGCPDTYSLENQCIEHAQAIKTSIDTVFISDENLPPEDQTGYAPLKRLAEQTGGIFLVFQRGKVNFRTAFKYLSPGLRLMLADSAFKARIEAGTV